jgi:hypothetical protein
MPSVASESSVVFDIGQSDWPPPGSRPSAIDSWSVHKGSAGTGQLGPRHRCGAPHCHEGGTPWVPPVWTTSSSAVDSRPDAGSAVRRSRLGCGSWGMWGVVTGRRVASLFPD